MKNLGYAWSCGAAEVLPNVEVVRAQIVLQAADGVRKIDIAERVGVCVDVASRWRKRFCEQGLLALKGRPRSGRPRRVGSNVVSGIKALACEPPEQRDVIAVEFG